MRLGILGSTNFYTLRTVHMIRLNNYDMAVAIYKPALVRVNDEIFIRASRISPIFKITNPLVAVRHIKRLNKLSDVIILHSMHPLVALYILVFQKHVSIIYLPFGNDYKVGGIFYKLLKFTVNKRTTAIIVEFKKVKEYMHMKFDIPMERIVRRTIWPINRIYSTPISEEDKMITKQMTGLNEKIVIFSPRALRPNYNHKVIIKAISRLPDHIKDRVVLVMIDYLPDEEYKREVIKLASSLNINIRLYNGPLSPQQMKILYSISDITINIPNSDQFGASLMEAALCGSPQILNQKIETYHEKFSHHKNCLFVEPTPEHLAQAIKLLLLEPKIRKKISYRAKRLFLDRLDWEKIGRDVLSFVEEVTLTFKRKGETK